MIVVLDFRPVVEMLSLSVKSQKNASYLLVKKSAHHNFFSFSFVHITLCTKATAVEYKYIFLQSYQISTGPTISIENLHPAVANGTLCCTHRF